MDILRAAVASMARKSAAPIVDAVSIVAAVELAVVQSIEGGPRKVRLPPRHIAPVAAVAAMAKADIADGAMDIGVVTPAEAVWGCVHAALVTAAAAAVAAASAETMRRAMVERWQDHPDYISELMVIEATTVAECAAAAAATASTAATDCHGRAAEAILARGDADAVAAIAEVAASAEKRVAAAAETVGHAHATALRLSFDAILVLNPDLSMQCGGEARSPRKRQRTKEACPDAHRTYSLELRRAANSTAAALAMFTTATRTPRPSDWRVQAEFARVRKRFRVCPRAVALLEEYGVGQTIFGHFIDLLCLSLAVRMWQASPREQWNFVCGFDELEARVDW